MRGQAISAVRAASPQPVHYPCAKHAWVEFPGERPDPAIDRVETA